MTPRFKLGVVFVSTLLTLMLVVGSLIGRGQESDGAYRPLAVYSRLCSAQIWTAVVFNPLASPRAGSLVCELSLTRGRPPGDQRE